MSDETGSPAGMESVALPADAPDAFESPSAAAEYFTALREKPKKQAESAEPEEAATAEEPAPQEQDSDPETAHAETTEETEPAEEPPIERPRSWAKELDEEWASYPREAQEKIARREQERDAAIRRSQNEAAEARKAAQAERDAAEQARKQYEAKLPDLMQELQSVTQSNYSDIRTMDDVVKLQSEDPFRFQAWQVHQMRLQAAKAEDDRAKAEKANERQGKRANYEATENKRLVELVPEMADPKKATELRERAIAMLTDDLGLKNEQLSQWMADDTGHEILSNAGIQKLIADGLKYRDILKAPKAVATKPLPPVQKPGISRQANASVSEREQALIRQLNEDGSLSAAQELRALQTRQRRS